MEVPRVSRHEISSEQGSDRTYICSVCRKGVGHDAITCVECLCVELNKRFILKMKWDFRKTEE